MNGRVVGPPWRVVDRQIDRDEAMAVVRDVADRIAAQVKVPAALPVTPTDAEWLALFDPVGMLAEREFG